MRRRRKKKSGGSRRRDEEEGERAVMPAKDLESAPEVTPARAC